MKVAKTIEKINAVDLDPGNLNYFPWVTVIDLPNGHYPSISIIEEPITHWVEKNYVFKIDVVDIPQDKITSKYKVYVPECEVVVYASEFEKEKLAPMSLGCRMARKAHEKMELYSHALAEAGCTHVILFIMTRPALIITDKKDRFVILQFSACGWKE